MAAALDSSYTPKEIKDVPVDPAAASMFNLSVATSVVRFWMKTVASAAPVNAPVHNQQRS